MSPIQWILNYRVVAILRGVAPANMRAVAEALYSGGIRLMEITLNSPDAINQIRVLVSAYSGRMLIGAGTVLDVNDARAAISAGAEFLISPGLDEDVVQFTKGQNVVSIPGAFTPTEVMRAHKVGADIVKIFPVNSADYIRNIAAPLDKIPMMPTGGISAQNIAQFRAAGAVAFGIGSALVSKAEHPGEEYFSTIERRASELVAAVGA